MHHFWLSEEARLAEIAAEVKSRRRVLALARSQRWPQLELRMRGGHRHIIRGTRAHWEHFTSTGTPLMLICAIAKLWPQFAESR